MDFKIDKNGFDFEKLLAALPNTPDMDELKELIRKDAAKGIDFGCKCYYCEATPIDLVERGDCIPVIYGTDAKQYCFRCSEEAYYGGINEFIKDSDKQKECLKAFR